MVAGTRATRTLRADPKFMVCTGHLSAQRRCWRPFARRSLLFLDSGRPLHVGLVPRVACLSRQSASQLGSGQAARDFQREFDISGEENEIVTKVGDFKESHWAVPIAGTLKLFKGCIYRWTLRLEHICSTRPEMQIGVHAKDHRRPWRLMTTTRCSRARDEDPWQERPGGDRMLKEGDFVHVEVDLRGLHLPFGTLAFAINSEPAEIVFDDIALSSSMHMMPVVCMGSDGSRVRVCPAF
ncbi:unnamed protein product [Symbiodinium sp. CCMP2456]|nr:unnamed protein product [Symbiodinium sp. CCMP2456]